MCYNSKKWTDARDAIIKSAMAVPLYCKDPNASSLDDLSDFEVGAMPEFFEHPNEPGKQIKVNPSQLTYNFDLTDEVHCYLQFFIKCRNPFKTAGMGDTISGTGFIYHQPIF